MSAHYPGIGFSIRAEGPLWLWRATLDDVTLAEGRARTRAIAAAQVIQVICRVYGPETAASAVRLAKAA
ncbi:hypothetical protein [uncultured Caulobacter sp.]|uniref:hypothetical protein n=1 Tax=uncultured Caulobacter sp. TaxID=158749 RepID=UPI00260612AC|nr:hypothetical protein [uncultured Caulobacter sp.]